MCPWHAGPDAASPSVSPECRSGFAGPLSTGGNKVRHSIASTQPNADVGAVNWDWLEVRKGVEIRYTQRLLSASAEFTQTAVFLNQPQCHILAVTMGEIFFPPVIVSSP